MDRLDPDFRAAYERAIDGLATAEKKAWWDAYLKGAIDFRGISLPILRSTVLPWFRRHTTDWDDGRLSAATAFLSEPLAEDKLTGVLLLEWMEREIDDDALEAIAERFRAGDVTDWNTTDWLSIKALSGLAARDARLAERLVSWVRSDAEPPWLHRAGLVAFVPAAEGRRPATVDLVSEVLPAAATLAADRRRFSQTAVGWFLRELSRAHAEVVAAFVEAHRAVIGPEARSMALARIEGRIGAARRRANRGAGQGPADSPRLGGR